MTGELTADFARALPGGKMDGSDYEAIESALDRADAPMQDASGKWLALAERVVALSASRTAAETRGGWLLGALKTLLANKDSFDQSSGNQADAYYCLVKGCDADWRAARDAVARAEDRP